MDGTVVQQRKYLGEVISEMKKRLSDGGIDITPLKHLIHEMVDEKKIRSLEWNFVCLRFPYRI